MEEDFGIPIYITEGLATRLNFKAEYLSLSVKLFLPSSDFSYRQSISLSKQLRTS